MINLLKKAIDKAVLPINEAHKRNDLYFTDKTLNECQNEILTANPDSPSIKLYSEQERLYWEHVPLWIYEQNRHKRIKQCLDIGCAFGTLALFSKKISNCNIYCIDRRNDLLKESIRKKYSINFSLSNIEFDQMPWDKKFDTIIFTEIIEHLNYHPLSTLKKIREALSKDGSLYLSTPDASQWGRISTYYKTMSDMPYPSSDKISSVYVEEHVYQYGEDELVELVKSAGFKIDKFDYSRGVEGVGRHLTLKLKSDR